MKKKIIGVLAFHGDVIEHIEALKHAAKALRLPVDVVSVRTPDVMRTLDGLVLPGGESTTLRKLCEREGVWEPMKTVPNIFGTCAGAILLAKGNLGLMDIEVERNAYGRQAESFEKILPTALGTLNAIFIRAPKFSLENKTIQVLAEYNGEVLACEQKKNGKYYLAASFHPELTSLLFHEHFLSVLFCRPLL